MESWILGLIVAVVNVIVTTVAGLIIKNIYEKKTKEKDELERLREEQRLAAENRRCEVVKEAVHLEVTQLENKVKEEFSKSREETKAEMQNIKDDVDAVKDDLGSIKRTMQKDTRRSLRQDAALYIKRGWATGQEKTEYDELYWCYHNLGKNGVVDSDHAKVMDLPEEAPKGE